LPERDDDADRPEPAPELEALPEGALRRGFKLGRAVLGAVGRAAGGRLLGDKADGAQAGERLAATLGQMKGLSMKLGQMLSYVDLELSPGLRKALGRLQQQSAPMKPELVARTVEEDLGEPPHRLFAHWEEQSFAAASIGQVHRARLGDGTEVAVKVRYPAIARIVRDDLKNLELMRHLFKLAAPELYTQALLAELRERSLEECDYRQEARNQEAFRRFFAGREGVIVPEVYEQYSSERVLTTELIHGRGFHEFSAQASQSDRNQAAHVIHDFAFRSIYQMGALNCDPHPGNYLFTQRGVAFLDFGCVRRFSDDLVETWRTMVRSALERDREVFREAVVRMGLAGPSGPFDFEAHYRQYLHLIRPWLTTEAVSLTPEFVASTYRMLLMSNPNRASLRMPRELLFANRLLWGLYSVLAELRSTLSLREAILGILYEPGEPTPEPFSDSELRSALRDLERPR
jgi:predicted unusual protein kinase regulating ubiquinone biosynthesis (AarF/ABC1/UbiB family)